MLEELTSKFRRLDELRVKRDNAKTAAKKAEDEYREYEAELWDELSESPVEGSLRFDFGGGNVVLFTPQETYYGRIVDREKAMKYFEERNEVEEISKREVKDQCLNDLVRDCLDNDIQLPPGVDFYARRYITVTRQK